MRELEKFQRYYGYKLPVRKEVCPSCDGHGTVTLPGCVFGSEDFAEDPDFAEEYFSGSYDRPCHECGGQNVVSEVDWKLVDQEIREEWDEWLESAAEMAAEHEAERRRGA